MQNKQERIKSSMPKKVDLRTKVALVEYNIRECKVKLKRLNKKGDGSR